MPTIRNKTPRALNLRIGRQIDAGDTLEVTAEEAQVLDGHPLLEITLDKATGSTKSSTTADSTSRATDAAAADTGADDASSTTTKTTKTTSKAGQAAATPEEDSK